MRRVVYSVACSLDGFIAREDHSYDWIPPDEDEDYGLSEFFKTLDTVLIGRKTYDIMVGAGQSAFPGVANYVFSRNPNPPTDKGVHWVATDPVAFVEELRDKPGKDIWLMGGSTLAKTFFDASAINQIKLAIVPVLLGKGIPLFREFGRETALKLIDHTSYPNGIVQLSYECL
ncbi:MAG: dihydrofolate reductase family protein [Acidobacteriaceae bacterium]